MNEHDQMQLAITAAVTLIWLACVIVCFLKWKTWTAVFGIIAPILSNIPIGGMYLHHIITEPFIYVGLPAAAIRLGKPVSWWAKWFYWGPLGDDRQLLRPSPKLARALARFPEQTVDFEKPGPKPSIGREHATEPPPAITDTGRAIDQSKIQEIISDGPERIGATIDAFCEDPTRKHFAQALLDAALEPYFLLQLAMVANKKVNAHVTIKKWSDAGLSLPAEGTPEYFPY